MRAAITSPRFGRPPPPPPSTHEDHDWQCCGVLRLDGLQSTTVGWDLLR
jgi:hypothetical protein